MIEVWPYFHQYISTLSILSMSVNHSFCDLNYRFWIQAISNCKLIICIISWGTYFASLLWSDEPQTQMSWI